MMMMMMVIIVPIIIIIIVGMSIPNTQSRPKNARGNHRKKTRTHTMPQVGRRETSPSRPTPGPHHTTPQGGGNHWGGGGEGGGGATAEPGSYIYIYMYVCLYVCLLNYTLFKVLDSRLLECRVQGLVFLRRVPILVLVGSYMGAIASRVQG